MILYTNGCSYTYGDELEHPHQQAWPYRLGDALSCKVINEAQCGVSNDCIMRMTLDYLTKNTHAHKDLLVVIMWTFLGRFDYYDDVNEQFVTISPHGTVCHSRNRDREANKPTSYKKPRREEFSIEVYDPDTHERQCNDEEDDLSDKNSWSSRWLAVHSKGVHDAYDSYTNICSDKWDAYRHFHHVLCLQNFLRMNNIRYMFCNVGYTEREQDWKRVADNMVTDYLPSNYVQQIDAHAYPCLTDWKLGMTPYAYLNGGTRLPNGHPDAESHKTYADYLAGCIK